MKQSLIVLNKKHSTINGKLCSIYQIDHQFQLLAQTQHIGNLCLINSLINCAHWSGQIQCSPVSLLTI